MGWLRIPWPFGSKPAQPSEPEAAQEDTRPVCMKCGKHFDPDAMVKRYFDVYDRAINLPGKIRPDGSEWDAHRYCAQCVHDHSIMVIGASGIHGSVALVTPQMIEYVESRRREEQGNGS